MYAPRHFREDRRDVLIEAIHALRFATLVVSGPDGPEAVHLPLVASPGDRPDNLVLDGHVAVANPLWRLIADGVPALAIFQGPHAYVHPGWLATKRETGRAVPTWNHVAVHAHGRLTAIRDAAWLRAHVEALTALTEAGRADPWAVEDAPPGYIDGMIGGIVGLRIAVARIEGVWKLMQNHPEANRLGVIAGLANAPEPGARAVADAMAAREHGG